MQDKLKWTAGPWIVRAAQRGAGFEVAPVTDTVGQPAEVAEVSDGYDNAEANAHLIAAAPDLAEALEGLLRHPGIVDMAPEDKDAEDHALERTARAALARAQGRG